MRGYTRALLFQHSQSGACNAAHSVRSRLARWLLQTTDIELVIEGILREDG